MQPVFTRSSLLYWLACAFAVFVARCVEAQDFTRALAAAAQNPVAAMYSLPFQNGTFLEAGLNNDKTANVLNIQPLLPFTVGDWNIISRTIAPLIYVPSTTTSFGAAALGEVTTAANAGRAGVWPGGSAARGTADAVRSVAC
jgi:hypothetical protein